MITAAERELIDTKIHREFVRSVIKHGTWKDYKYPDMMLVIIEELEEVITAMAMKDYDGEHGALAELAQVSACCQKFMMQILRREMKCNQD